jgi:hypothetical protein
LTSTISAETPIHFGGGSFPNAEEIEKVRADLERAGKQVNTELKLSAEASNKI